MAYSHILILTFFIIISFTNMNLAVAARHHISDFIKNYSPFFNPNSHEIPPLPKPKLPPLPPITPPLQPPPHSVASPLTAPPQSAPTMPPLTHQTRSYLSPLPPPVPLPKRKRMVPLIAPVVPPLLAPTSNSPKHKMPMPPPLAAASPPVPLPKHIRTCGNIALAPLAASPQSDFDAATTGVFRRFGN